MSVQPELDLGMTVRPWSRNPAVAAWAARESAEERAAWSVPATCPSCGATEPDGYALYRLHDLTPNRRYEPTWPCRAQRRQQ